MRPSTIFTVSAGLMLSAPVFAQGITTPPGCGSLEGPGRSSVMGAWSNMRVQQADDMHRGNKSYTIVEVAFRLDNMVHDESTAMGRSWTNIGLTMSEQINFGTMSLVFASNVGASPTMVFRSKWSWPTRTGTPLLRPDAWGGATGRLRVPFTKPWFYSGKYSILADYTFQGGTLDNNGTWKKDLASYYVLDGENIHIGTRSGGNEPVPDTINRPRCGDSAYAATTAFASTAATVHGKMSATVALRGRLDFTHYSYWTAPDAPVIHALGLAGSTKGIDIGAGCNRLHVNVGQPTAYVALRARTRLSEAYARYLVPFDQSFAGLNVYIQGGWTDSKTKSFKLTTAVRATLPNGWPPDREAYKTLFSSSATSTQGYGGWMNGGLFPYTLWKTR